ncbi:2-oxo-4-hydroxy-4-carboxy-5-ureidoimidazoline decarboxylase [Oceanisphaera sp.]|uniref:2-oxo-4-hydroxy-4-carboxy-5-ureidoimidazoline decarboxylase n=1 Tax=Oceanisphaera sp. TaxID=1929979 RepID=UPI003A8F3B09
MSRFTGCTPSTMGRAEFVAAFADIYEHSPWVAEQVFDQGLTRDDDQIEQLHSRMAAVMNNADQQAQLEVINAHPDLAGKAAVEGTLTLASTHEQAGAGIDQCSAEEFARFTELNQAYRAKFRFPFIMAVKGANRHQILAAFEARIHNDYDTEFARAVQEINKIAEFRLRAM